MRHLKLFPATVDSERRVVEEEKRLRVDNDPIGKAIEKFRALAYVKHPYNWTPIGTIEDLEKVTPADCQRFYDAYYQPNNATLVVIGDVDEAAVRKLIDAALRRRSRAGPAPPRTTVEEPPQTATRAETLQHRGPDPGRRRRLPHPARGRSRTSPRWRCWRRCSRAASRRACTSAWCGTSTWRSRRAASPRRWSSRGCSSSTPRICPIAMRRASQAVLAEEIAARARQAGHARRARQGEEPAGGRVRVRAADRRRRRPGARSRAVRRGRLAALRRGRDRATWRSPPPTCSGWRRSTWSTRNLTRVTLAQPAASGGADRRPRTRTTTGARRDDDAVFAVAGRLAASAPRRPRRPPRRPSGRRGAVRASAPGGGQAQADTDVLGRAQRISIRAPRAAEARPRWRCRPCSASRSRTGSRSSSSRARTSRWSASASPSKRAATTSGAISWACPTSSRRCSGAGPRRAAPTTSRSAIDFVGGSLDAQATNEATNAGCSSLSKDAKLCLDLLSDILLHPSFPESEMGEVRDEMLAAIAARFDNPHALANAHFENQLFGEKHPDGWMLAAEDVRKITRESLEEFWKTFYRPNRAILAVAGDVDAGEAARRHREGVRRLGAWQGAGARPTWYDPQIAATRILLVDRPDSTQATIVLGHAGDQARRSALVRRDADELRAGRVRLLVAPDDRGARQAGPHLRHRFIVRRARCTRGPSASPARRRTRRTWEALLASVNEIRRMKAEGPTAGGAGQGQGLLRRQLPVQAADRGRRRAGAGRRRAARSRRRLRARAAAAAGGRRRGGRPGRGGRAALHPIRRWS